MAALETVLKIVGEWQPDSLPTELRYRDSLTALIRERLKDAKVETEYRHSGTTIDIYVKQQGFLVASEVFVELKRNLLQKAQLDRLVGQLHGLQPNRNKIVVVLCGETNPALVTRFKELFPSAFAEVIWDERMMTLVVKPDTAKAARSGA